MNGRKLFGAVSTIAVILGLVACTSSPVSGQKAPVKITVLHTNDMHGSYLPSVATWEPEKPMVGGVVALDYYVRQEKGKSPRSLLLDAGDLMTGTLICDRQYDGAYGGALVDMMNMIGYQGWVFGNHDFDKTASNLRKLISIAKFPVVCANLVKGVTLFAKEAYHIYDFDSLRVGVIGITYHHMGGMAAFDKLDGFDTIDPVKTVSDAVGRIDSLTDLIIVLSHLGIENDRELAKSVKGVDLIVGGHSHTRLEKPEVVNGVLIVQTGSNCRNLGEVELTVAGDSVMAYDGRLIPMYAKGIEPDPRLAALVDSIKTDIDKEYGVVIAHLKGTWKSEYRAESNIGDWLAEALRTTMKTDVAFLNSGGIRKDLDPGPVTQMDIYEILPFDNKVVTFSLTGKDLTKIAEHNVGLEKNSYQGTLQMAGISYTWAGNYDQPRLVEVRVGGAPVDPNKIYTVATLDYVALSNADKYFGFVPQNVKTTDLTLTQLVLDAVQKAGVIEGKLEGRIKKIE